MFNHHSKRGCRSKGTAVYRCPVVCRSMSVIRIIPPPRVYIDILALLMFSRLCTRSFQSKVFNLLSMRTWFYFCFQNTWLLDETFKPRCLRFTVVLKNKVNFSLTPIDKIRPLGGGPRSTKSFWKTFKSIDQLGGSGGLSETSRYTLNRCLSSSQKVKPTDLKVRRRTEWCTRINPGVVLKWDE